MSDQAIPKPDDDRDLEDLLDEALSVQSVPGGVPDDLVDRIDAQTADRLQVSSSGVLARIGPFRVGAIAAAVMLTAMISVVVLNERSRPTESPDMQMQQAWSETVTDDIGDEIQLLAVQDDDIDRDIQLLATAIDEFENLDLADTGTTSMDDELAEFEVQYNGLSSSLF